MSIIINAAIRQTVKAITDMYETILIIKRAHVNLVIKGAIKLQNAFFPSQSKVGPYLKNDFCKMMKHCTQISCVNIACKILKEICKLCRQYLVLL